MLPLSTSLLKIFLSVFKMCFIVTFSYMQIMHFDHIPCPALPFSPHLLVVSSPFKWSPIYIHVHIFSLDIVSTYEKKLKVFVFLLLAYFA
jgi:hypothetical protein